MNSKEAKNADPKLQAKAWGRKAIDLESKVDPNNISSVDKAQLKSKVAADIKAQGSAKKADAKDKADDKKAKEKAKAQDKKVE